MATVPWNNVPSVAKGLRKLYSFLYIVSHGLKRKSTYNSTVELRLHWILDWDAKRLAEFHHHVTVCISHRLIS